MHGTEKDHQKDHFEEHQKYVAVGQQQTDASQNGTRCALHDRHSQRVQSLFDFVVGMWSLRRHVRITNVRRKVNGKADAHNQIYHRNGIEIDVPQRHIAGDTQFDRYDAQCDPQGAQEVRYEYKRNYHHDDGANDHTLYGGGSYEFKLIEEHEVRMENGYIQRRILTYLPQISDHNFFVICVRYVNGLD